MDVCLKQLTCVAKYLVCTRQQEISQVLFFCTGTLSLRFIFRQLLNLACRVVKAQMGFKGSGLSPSSATDFLRDLGQVFSQGSQNLAGLFFFLSPCSSSQVIT